MFTFVNADAEKQTVAVDESSGAPVDLASLITGEAGALAARCGRLDRALCDRLATAAASDLPVVAWLVHSTPDLDRGLMDRGPSFWEEAVRRVNDDARTTTERVGLRVEASIGARMYPSPVAPVLSGRLSASQIAVLATDPEVGLVMLGAGDPVNDLVGSVALSGWSSYASVPSGTGTYFALAWHRY